jgi:ferric-dicitrate binding protein FerR (iron transport regulator)
MRLSERIGLLMFKYLRDELSPEETEELNSWRFRSPENEEIFLRETDPELIRKDITEMYRSREAILEKIKERYPGFAQQKSVLSGLTVRIVSVAAFGALLFGFGWYFLSHKTREEKSILSDPTGISRQIRPGGNHAELIMANGSTILLDSIQEGTVAKQGSYAIIKKAEGEITYSKDALNGSNGVQYNILRTPRGGQFALELSDGTKVWLNAASSLRYPVSFRGSERKVMLDGEAYFEVSKNEHAPFEVSAGNMEIEVLGTHFNVMAYQDEPHISTTLLQGKVRITRTDLKENKDSPTHSSGSARSGYSVVILPGEQAQVRQLTGTMENIQEQADQSPGTIKVLKRVDVDAIVAWKNGNTSLEHAGIQEIMRAISRWYDVEIEFQGKIPEKKYKGDLPRNTELGDLLHALSLSGIHFKVEGKKIIVTP